MKYLLVALSFFFAVSGSSSLDIKFRFFYGSLEDTKTIKYGGDITSVIGTRFFSSANTLVIFPEYTYYEQSRAAKPLIESFLKCSKRDYNIIYVDYTAYTRKDADFTLEIVNQLERAIYETLLELNVACGGFSYSHLIGFGFGSYVAAEVGRFFKKEQDFEINRITYLDPSGKSTKQVYRVWLDDIEPLGPDSASFVDAIHTSAMIGNREPVAHVDFFVNDGFVQEHCKNMWKMAYYAIFDVQKFVACSHEMCWEYWDEGICSDHRSFIAYRCPSCTSNGKVLNNFKESCTERTEVSMGIFTEEIAGNTEMYGCYYVPVNENFPFSKD